VEHVISRRKIILAAPALILPCKALAWRNGSSAIVSGLTFNLILDPSWSGAPSSYTTGSTSINQAVSLLQAAYPHVNATINLHVGYGTQWLSAGIPANPVGAGQSVGNTIGNASIPYSNIRSAMAGLSFQSTSLAAALSNLPTGGSLQSTSSFTVSSANCKALGLFGFSGGPTSSTDSIIDGSIGMGSGWSSAKLLGVFLHEITHALGRDTLQAPFMFTRFTAPGTWDFSNSATNAIFSLDGGNTTLANYDHPNDFSDFLNFTDGTGVQDPLDCFSAFQETGANQFLSTLDNQLMNSMGWQ
jgi:hypothetical protein